MSSFSLETKDKNSSASINTNANIKTEPKRTLRRELVEKKKQITMPEFRASAYSAMRWLSHHLIFREARYLCTYIAMKRELDTAPFINLGILHQKRIYVPMPDFVPLSMREILYSEGHNGGHIAGSYYITKNGNARKMEVPRLSRDEEDISIEKLGAGGLVLVPGLGFSYDGARLGRGGGYYDRLLSRLSLSPYQKTISVGLCHSKQIVEKGKIPLEAHDKKVDYILTEEGIYKT